MRFEVEVPVPSYLRGLITGSKGVWFVRFRPENLRGGHRKVIFPDPWPRNLRHYCESAPIIRANGKKVSSAVGPWLCVCDFCLDGAMNCAKITEIAQANQVDLPKSGYPRGLVRLGNIEWLSRWLDSERCHTEQISSHQCAGKRPGGLGDTVVIIGQAGWLITPAWPGQRG
jgi:hypothetical protein